MIGWWQPEAPVRTVAANGSAAVGLYATSFVIPSKRTLVAVASWANETVAFKLTVDWAVLRLDHAKVTQISAPSVAGMQNVSAWTWAQTIPVAPEQGVLLVLEPTGAKSAGLV